ncbi:diacylglycerol kinase (ATP) [Conyzicola nivalis]|uniref:Diacylglycerol kinase (ATP) n=1 Tax=Conyzicola nivalis TaxID=1477021 RepID=A0ABV2QQ96_9MICO
MPTPENTHARQAAVVYNPIKVDILALKTAVAAAADDAGWLPPLWFETTLQDAGQLVTATAIARGADLVLAAGGDGTVRAVAEGLRDTGVAMALLPSGTGNLLARNLDIGFGTLDEAIHTALHGVDRTIDLGLASIVRADGVREEHVFLVMAGLGLDAKMIANTNSKLKKAVGWLAYVDAGIRSLPEIKPVRLRLSVDGEPERSVNVHTIIIGNCGKLPGGILLIPDAKPDDGVLDFVALRPRGPFGWINVWNKVAWENGVLRKSALGRRIIDLSRDVKDVTYLTGRDLRMVVEVPQEFQLDGDEFGEARSVHTWVDPGALTVRVPEGSF